MIVFVTDARIRNALAAVRSLGRQGHEVWAGGTSRFDQCFYSRYYRRRVIYPPPAEDPERFADFMIQFVTQNSCDVLLPVSDYATLFCAEYREQLSKHVHLAVPVLKALRRAHGKSDLPHIANEARVDVPSTFAPQDDEELWEISEQIAYPCVVKPRRGESAVGVWYAESAEELRARYHDSPFRSDAVHDFSRPVIQEYISGPTHDACLLFDHGEPIAASTQRRIKTYPIEGGKGIVCETTDEPQVRNKPLNC